MRLIRNLFKGGERIKNSEIEPFIKCLKHHNKTELALWHEVSVLKDDQAIFEYINCHLKAGLLPYSELTMTAIKFYWSAIYLGNFILYLSIKVCICTNNSIGGTKMPINIPKNLPAGEILRKEKIFVMEEERAKTQQIRPLNI